MHGIFRYQDPLFGITQFHSGTLRRHGMSAMRPSLQRSGVAILMRPIASDTFFVR